MSIVNINKEKAFKNFFDTYSKDIEHTLYDISSKEELKKYLDGDIFIACASAATGIKEKEFIEYSFKYFGLT